MGEACTHEPDPKPVTQVEAGMTRIFTQCLHCGRPIRMRNGKWESWIPKPLPDVAAEA
jgi:hypothetical protein